MALHATHNFRNLIAREWLNIYSCKHSPSDDIIIGHIKHKIQDSSKMSLSEDEDEFQSADEEGFDSSHGDARSNSKESMNDKTPMKKRNQHVSAKNDELIEDEKTNIGGTSKDNNYDDQLQSKDKARSDNPVAQEEAFLVGLQKSDSDSPPSSSANNEDDDDDEEEILAERIRERNLKIARKFSAEVAKNHKSSAPIPMKTSCSKAHPTSSKEQISSTDPMNLADTELAEGMSKLSSSFQPPAPPPTPALSSSFSQLNDCPATISTPTLTSSTQYGWRIPSARQTPPSTSQPGTPKGESSSTSDVHKDRSIKNEQARLALDRLSDKLSQIDQGKNLFDQVAADLRKVSMKPSEPTAGSQTTDLPAIASSLTDLGSTISGWGWSGASKLFSSATQVTSQVGSVFETVVNLPQQLQPQTNPSSESGLSVPQGKEQQVLSDQSKIDSEVKPQQQKKEQKGESMPGEPLVDLTLSAMESLGKRAFDVMTTRDESGVIQIKGLGRPWEHIIGIANAGQQGNSHTDSANVDKRVERELSSKKIDSDAVDERQRLSEERKGSAKLESRSIETDSEYKENFHGRSPSEENQKKTIDFIEPKTKADSSAALPPTLKNRKRRLD